MKKILLATTAMVGASLLTSAAFAEVSVSVGGRLKAQIVGQDGDNGNDIDGQTDNEVFVRIKGKSDSGLEYGGKVELEADTGTNNNVDEALIFIKGGFGTVNLGDEDGVNSSIFFDAANVSIYGDGFGPGTGGIDGDFAVFDTAPLDSSDSTKITYISPNLSGFKAGISYVPTYSTGMSANFNADIKNGIETAISYSSEFDGGKFVATAGYTFAEGTKGLEDVNSYGISAAVNFGGFNFGAGYLNQGASFASDIYTEADNADDEKFFYLAGIYNLGGFQIGAQYGHVTTEGDVGSGNEGDDKFNIFSVGTSYAIVDGLTAYGEILFTDIDDKDAGNDDDNTTQFLFGTQLDF